MHRVSTRIILLSPESKFLLFLSNFDPGSNLPPRWIFPGGGVEQNETALEGAVRELREETGLEVEPERLVDLGQTLFFQQEDTRKFKTGESHFFKLEIQEEFEPKRDFWTQDEIRDTLEHRWWSLEEIQEHAPWVGPDGAIELLHKLLG